MGSGNGSPEFELVMTMTFLVTVPIITKGLAGEEKPEEASEPPTSCQAYHCLSNNPVSTQNKDSKIKEEDSQLG